MAFRKTMLVAGQAGKTVLIGTMTGHEIVQALRSQHIRVNPHAQRSLMKGAYRETTAELLDNDRIESMPRMKSFLKFAERLMDQLREGKNTEGFLGAIQLVIPDTFTDARLVFAGAEGVKEGSYEVMTALRALGSNRLATFEAQPAFNEPVLHLADGQARCFLLHSLERVAKKKINQQQKLIRKAEKAHESTETAKATLATLEATLKEVQTFLTDLHLGVMIYADSILPDGRIKGLPVGAEQRLYIEGNALNSQASQEEVLKYEQYSPVIVALRDIRDGEDFTWMSDEYIESDSKTISSASIKLFTLSALVQAFSFSIIDNNQPLKKFDSDMQDVVSAHTAFVEAYWAKVAEVFGPTWVPNIEQKPGERLLYLESMRGQGRRNVCFQAIFLLALGRLGYEMGLAADWDPDHDVIAKLDRLDPGTTDYDAERQMLGDDGKLKSTWVERWTNTMMKQSLNDDGEVVGYSFNNSRENLEATFRLLAKLADFAPRQRGTKAAPAEAIAEPVADLVEA
jgi:hypothetical protein